MSADETCQFQVPDPPHYFHRYTCGRKAKHVRDGHACCGIHVRVFDRLGRWGLGAFPREERA